MRTNTQVQLPLLPFFNRRDALPLRKRTMQMNRTGLNIAY